MEDARARFVGYLYAHIYALIFHLVSPRIHRLSRAVQNQKIRFIVKPQ
jgi:hypothetical protein